MHTNGLASSAQALAAGHTAEAFAPKAAPAVAGAGRPGQTLERTGLSSSHDGASRLPLGGQPAAVAARGEAVRPPGQAAAAQVARPAASPVTSGVLGAPHATLGRAWRSALPRQIPLERFVAVISGYARQAAAPDTPLNAAARQFLAALPALPALGLPSALRQVVSASGLFLESRLAAEEQVDGNDLKAQLLRLAQQIRAWTSASPTTAAEGQGQTMAQECLRHIEAALARIQINQLAALPGGEEPPAWIIELPVRHHDGHGVLRLRIDPERRDTRQAAADGWSVWLSLELPSLGVVHARVQWHGERASVAFWAERAATAVRLREQLDGLRADLREAGLETGRLSCQDGAPPRPPGPQCLHDLLDERA